MSFIIEFMILNYRIIVHTCHTDLFVYTVLFSRKFVLKLMFASNIRDNYCGIILLLVFVTKNPVQFSLVRCTLLLLRFELLNYWVICIYLCRSHLLIFIQRSLIYCNII